MVPKTLARVATALRTFMGFLYMTGRIRRNLAIVVASPRVVRGDSPPRALAWSDVRRILHAISRKTRNGLRDYALLLTMAAYGLGAGEARGLTIESVDWRRRELHVVRPKTGRAVDLPLLPGVKLERLAAYLRRGRPCHCTTRALFVRLRAPYVGFSSSGAIRHILQKHAMIGRRFRRVHREATSCVTAMPAGRLTWASQPPWLAISSDTGGRSRRLSMCAWP